MVGNLYETLGLNSSATKDEVKKAYRRAALQTHPDKLPPGASEQDKLDAQEKFRTVNNAYEVLSDESKRRIYDQCGEWPPPETERDTFASPRGAHRSSSHDFGFGQPFSGFPFSDPFFASPFGTSSSRPRNRPQDFYAFSDPFAFFNHVFEDVFRDFDQDPFFSNRHRSRDPFGHGHAFSHDHFLMGTHSPFGLLPSAFGQSSAFPFGGQMAGFSSSSRGLPGGNGRWISQSQMTRTVNGVTESVLKRTDAEGNEHVTYSYPDGSEKHVVNGIEQPAQNGGNHSLPPPNRADHALPPPPAYPSFASEPRPERERARRREYRDRVDGDHAPVIPTGDYRDERAREKYHHRFWPHRTSHEERDHDPDHHHKQHWRSRHE